MMQNHILQFFQKFRFLHYNAIIYNPSTNFGTILLVTLYHVVKTHGTVIMKQPPPALSSDCFRGKET